MIRPGPLLRLLAKLAPPGAACSAGAIGDMPPSPYDEEERIVGNVAASRRREFRAGRFHARKALMCLNLPGQAISRRADRAPCWPQAHVGSISHSPIYCAAVAARCKRLAGIGIDIEPLAPVSPLLGPAILTSEEQARRHGPPLRSFSAKEAVFKACSSAGVGSPGFKDIDIAWQRHRFTAQVRGLDEALTGACGVAQGHFVALAWIPAPLRHADMEEEECISPKSRA